MQLDFKSEQMNKSGMPDTKLFLYSPWKDKGVHWAGPCQAKADPGQPILERPWSIKAFQAQARSFS